MTPLGNMATFISKFLSNRKFSVRIGGTLSDMYNQEEGVPQGSILSVTLFSLKINSIIGCRPGARRGITCVLFANRFLGIF